jgi:hypothetical protein
MEKYQGNSFHLMFILPEEQMIGSQITWFHRIKVLDVDPEIGE